MTILDELRWRGLLADCTDLEALTKRLAEGPVTLYAGFDPTADSLHVGNLVPLFALRRFQLHGHHPIALAGGSTGMIGDPSGKSDERNLLTPEQLARNLEGIRPQLTKFLDFDAKANPARLVNNYDWTAPIGVLDFLRDVGKYITVNSMKAKDSVATRMEDRETGISYAEFSYMLLQGFDFYHLRKDFNCELQVGATDQWGNITVGTELTRKKLGATVWGLVFPLLTKSDGTKYGKTASGAVWLDPNRTRPDEFYQFFVKADDADVIKLLKVLTFLSVEEITSLESELKTNPSARAAQKKLALELTTLVHGAEIAEKVARAGAEIFGKKKISEQPKEIRAQIAQTMPNIDFDRARHRNLTEMVVDAGLCPSKGQARTLIAAGGIKVEGERKTDPNLQVTDDMFAFGNLFLQKGNSANVVFVINQTSAPKPRIVE